MNIVTFSSHKGSAAIRRSAPPPSITCAPTTTCIPSAPANVLLPQTCDQSGQHCTNSATNFMPVFSHSTISSTIAPLVPPIPSTINRSVCFTSNLQHTFYQTVAYNTPPLPPTGTGIPYGPVRDAFFNGTPQPTHFRLPELPPNTHVAPAPQNNISQPFETFKEQIANMLREFGLEPRGRARAYQKPYPDHFDITPYPRGLKFLILLNLREKMVGLPLSI